MKNVTKVSLLLLFLVISLNSTAQFVKDVQTKIQVENVSAQDFSKKINADKTLQLIDVRTMGEYKRGHIKNAVLINFYDPNFAKNIEAAKLNKQLPIYIYCRSGNRSGHAVQLFKRLGFTHIINLAYGINDWNRSGLPINTQQPSN